MAIIFGSSKGNICRHKGASDRHLVIVFRCGNDRRKVTSLPVTLSIGMAMKNRICFFTAVFPHKDPLSSFQS